MVARPIEAGPASTLPASTAEISLLWDESASVFSWEAFSAYAALAVSQTARRDGSLSLLLVLLDLPTDLVVPRASGFEADAVRTASVALPQVARAGDVVGRRGSASFAVIAQDAQQAGAVRLAERIQATLAERFKLLDPSQRLNVSIGLASLPQAGRTLPDLLASAEEALRRSLAAGRNRVVVSDLRAGAGAAFIGSYAAPATPPVPSPYDPLTLQRRNGYRYLSYAVARGEIEGIGIHTRPSACPVCLDAARDVYRPGWAPELPLAGCTGPVGCRCVFGSPALDASRRPIALAPQGARIDGLPRKLRDAARFGADSGRGCKPEDLAEFLEAYPLFPASVDLGLPEGEPVLLLREARRGWDGAGAAGAAQGTLLPAATPMQPWLKRLGKPPALPSDALQFADDGTLSITSQRLLFGKPGALEGVALTDIVSVECFRDAIACTVSDFGNRMVFMLRDSVQVGLYLARALRDALLPPR
jgi:diguanylate cyclase (GGDEF)-like protein